jgi:SNF2 family DNA or RNA helicase
MTKKPIGDIQIEFSVAKFLRPHQVTAVRFILDRLTGKPFPITEVAKVNEVKSESNDDDDQFGTPIVQRTTRGDSSEKKRQEENGPPTGCILADEMGLGKTLTSIAVIYTLYKALGCKAVIVCPSSLVENWEKEIRKWLGVKVVPLVARPNNKLDDEISLFTNNNVPVLIISYEMFKKYAKVLNKCEKLNLVICDEGHRLKNSSGNQTTTSLNEFRAKMRMVLSGTVIQNDLEELYSVVEFVCPSYLGTLSHFRKNFSNPINAGSQVDSTNLEKARAEKAQALLKEMLGKIMIRRTQNEILSTLLPPKTNYFIFAKLTKIQEEKYAQVLIISIILIS